MCVLWAPARVANEVKNSADATEMESNYVSKMTVNPDGQCMVWEVHVLNKYI